MWIIKANVLKITAIAKICADTFLTVIFPGESEIAGYPLDYPSLLIPAASSWETVVWKFVWH